MMKKEIIKQPEMILVGISVQTRFQNEINPAHAKITPTVQRYFTEQLFNKIPNRVKPGTTYCIYTGYDDSAIKAKDNSYMGAYTYFVGEHVSSISDAIDLPNDLTILTIPAQTYAKFTTEPGAMPFVVIQAWQRIWTMKQADLGGVRRFHADFEVYDERAMNPKAATLDIYVGIKD